jgi:hypothetical protein
VGDSANLRHVSWDGEWFATFDKRRLNFIYQEERSDGRLAVLRISMGRLQPPGARWLTLALGVAAFAWFLTWVMFSPVIAGGGPLTACAPDCPAFLARGAGGHAATAHCAKLGAVPRRGADRGDTSSTHARATTCRWRGPSDGVDGSLKSF